MKVMAWHIWKISISAMAVKAENRLVWYDAQAEGEHVAGGTAKTAGVKFPLERNRYIFIGRWGHMVYWSDFERY